jgi:hypothetical protein
MDARVKPRHNRGWRWLRLHNATRRLQIPKGLFSLAGTPPASALSSARAPISQMVCESACQIIELGAGELQRLHRHDGDGFVDRLRWRRLAQFLELGMNRRVPLLGDLGRGLGTQRFLGKPVAVDLGLAPRIVELRRQRRNLVRRSLSLIRKLLVQRGELGGEVLLQRGDLVPQRCSLGRGLLFQLLVLGHQIVGSQFRDFAQLEVARILFLLLAVELLGGRGTAAQRLDHAGGFLKHLRIAASGQHAGEPPQEIDYFLVRIGGHGTGRRRHRHDSGAEFRGLIGAGVSANSCQIGGWICQRNDADHARLFGYQHRSGGFKSFSAAFCGRSARDE